LAFNTEWAEVLGGTISVLTTSGFSAAGPQSCTIFFFFSFHFFGENILPGCHGYT
jgi:hypothetical protein